MCTLHQILMPLICEGIYLKIFLGNSTYVHINSFNILQGYPSGQDGRSYSSLQERYKRRLYRAMFNRSLRTYFILHHQVCKLDYFTNQFSNGSYVFIVSITKFLFVISSPRAYLSRNRCVITWVSNYRYPMWTFCNWIPLIGYPRDSHVNCALFDGFLLNVSYSFQNLWEAPQSFSLKRSSQKIFLIPKFVIDTIN